MVAPEIPGEGGKQKDPAGGEWCWLKTKTNRSQAGKPGISLWHG